jgi:hypothetical protein
MDSPGNPGKNLPKQIWGRKDRVLNPDVRAGTKIFWVPPSIPLLILVFKKMSGNEGIKMMVDGQCLTPHKS